LGIIGAGFFPVTQTTHHFKALTGRDFKVLNTASVSHPLAVILF